jgi:putative transposase
VHKDRGPALSKALRGRRSKRAAKTGKALARRPEKPGRNVEAKAGLNRAILHRRVANRREDRNHQITARLVRAHKLIVTEDLAQGEAVPDVPLARRPFGRKPWLSVRISAAVGSRQRGRRRRWRCLWQA